MNRLDEALARLERAVARLEAACGGAAGNQAASCSVERAPEAATLPLRPAAMGSVAGGDGGLAGVGTKTEGRGVE